MSTKLKDIRANAATYALAPVDFPRLTAVTAVM